MFCYYTYYWNKDIEFIQVSSKLYYQIYLRNRKLPVLKAIFLFKLIFFFTMLIFPSNFNTLHNDIFFLKHNYTTTTSHIIHWYIYVSKMSISTSLHSKIQSLVQIGWTLCIWCNFKTPPSHFSLSTEHWKKGFKYNWLLS